MCAGAARHVSLAVPRRVCVTVDNLARLMRTVESLLTGVRFPAARIDAAARGASRKVLVNKTQRLRTAAERGPVERRRRRLGASRSARHAEAGAARRVEAGADRRTGLALAEATHTTVTVLTRRRPDRPARARAADCTRLAPRLQSNRCNRTGGPIELGTDALCHVPWPVQPWGRHVLVPSPGPPRHSPWSIRACGPVRPPPSPTS